MYTPSLFNEDDTNKLFQFIAENSFALILSVCDGGKVAHTQTPLILSEDRTKLLGHIARANPHWHSWEDSTVKVIFQGAHAYISPSFYQSSFNVPTWSYQTVSVDGVVRVISDPSRKIDIMQALVSQHESELEQPWELDLDDSRYEKLFEMIVFFEIEITGMKASFKLNQNKSRADQLSVISHLKSSNGLSKSQLIAEAMEQNIES